MYLQNTEARILNIGDLTLKPGFPTEIAKEQLDEYKKMYPIFNKKISEGYIVQLNNTEAKKQVKFIEDKIQQKLKEAEQDVQ